MAQLVTGDAVVLDVQVAQLPVRAVAALIDITVIIALTIAGAVLVTLTLQQLDPAWSMSLRILFVVLVPVAYPLIFEVSTRGRTLGKMAMGLRVVADDGGPERISQATFRALTSVVEIWLLIGSPAVICSMFSPHGKRLGDIFAGTRVISERAPRLAPPPMMPPGLAWWASSLQLSGLRPEQAETARQFLARAPSLDPARRSEIAYLIATDVVAVIAPTPPPGVPPEPVLAAVLAERHRRELARMQNRVEAGGGPGGAPPPTAPWSAPVAAGGPGGTAGDTASTGGSAGLIPPN